MGRGDPSKLNETLGYINGTMRDNSYHLIYRTVLNGAEALQEIGETMSRIAPVVSTNADSKVAATLAQVEKSLGMVPNLFVTLGNAPAALDGFLGLKKTLSRGRLTARQGEIVALAVGQENECRYCLSAHTQLSKAAGLSEADVLKVRSGDGDHCERRAEHVHQLCQRSCRH
jgi:AhpD family alkylhydroperoxidase